MGLGWDTTNGDCDIDASLILLDCNNNMVEIIYYGKLKSVYNLSVVHTGDNLTGEGEGDDEVIKIYLDKLDPKVVSIWPVVTIYDGTLFD